jgi:hypothetical protein
MKKIRRDKPIGVIMQINMEIPCFSFYLFCFFFFFFYKIREQEGRAVPVERGGLAAVERGR